MLVAYRSSFCLMASMVRTGAVSPVELVQAHLEQIERRNPAINAFVMILAESALAEARACEAALHRGEPLGLLHGVPVTVKDSFDIAGLPTNCGSRLRVGNRAAADAAAVALLRREGAVILGKTNTPEFLASYETDNFLTGRTNNPWDPERTSGGSSGGEAAAIATFCSPGGLATDGGGSIRVPAHFCGIAGLKPTPGRIPASGHFPSLGHPAGVVTAPGPMARTAEDLRLLFAALAAYDPQDAFSVPVPPHEVPAAKPRVFVWPRFYDVPVSPDVENAITRAQSLLASAGFALEEFRPAGLERAPNVWAFLFSKWPAPITRKMVEGHEADVHWTLAESISPATPTGEEVAIHLAMRDRLRASFLRQLPEDAVVLLPVCSVAAFSHRQRRFAMPGTEIGLFQAMMPAVLANVLGLPAVTVPIFKNREGLPIGVQFMGRPFTDELLLDVAVRLEARRGPWAVAEP